MRKSKRIQEKNEKISERKLKEGQYRKKIRAEASQTPQGEQTHKHEPPSSGIARGRDGKHSQKRKQNKNP